MKLDFSKPEELQTRNGRAVRIYATDGSGIYCVHGAIQLDGWWMQERWDNDGESFSGECRDDLVRKPARVTGWVNVYRSGRTGGEVWPTKEDAAKKAGVYSGVLVGQIYIDAEVQT